MHLKRPAHRAVLIRNLVLKGDSWTHHHAIVLCISCDESRTWAGIGLGWQMKNYSHSLPTLKNGLDWSNLQFTALTRI